jgi:mono/diheme cytochrome c family protein
MFVFAVALAGATASLLPASAQTPPAVAKDPFPESAGKPALLKVCGNCHTAETVIQSFRTRQEWSDVIDLSA